jgi:hypothetical protein
MKGIILAFFIIMLVLVVGCTSEESSSDMNDTVNETDVVTETNITEDDVELPPDIVDEVLEKRDALYQKELEAKGFGIFDFSWLNVENCDFYKQDFDEKIVDLREEIQDAEDEVAEESDDVMVLEQELDLAITSGNQNAIDRIRDDIEEEKDEIELAEEVVEDLGVLFKKHIIIRNEIKDFCRELKVIAGRSS